MKRIVTIVSARPQFIKSAPVSVALAEAGLEEIMVHTGQHYDPNMSDIFFNQLNLPKPHYNLEIGSGSHAYQTGEALKGIETILNKEQPDIVLVYGDTNGTLSGALAASKIHIPVAHIEAGLRSFNKRMPEEINRILTDHMSTWLFVPTETAITNLTNEGITQGVYPVGDVMLDATRMFQDVANQQNESLLESHGLEPKQYALLTMHRAETTDSPEQVKALLQTIDNFGLPVIFPVHPRTKGLIEGLKPFQHIQCIEPVSYLDMLVLESHANVILTDSGGVQKEAAFMRVPCITFRTETEWVETVESGWNTVVGFDTEKLAHTFKHLSIPDTSIHSRYGNGEAATTIANTLATTTIVDKQLVGV